MDGAPRPRHSGTTDRRTAIIAAARALIAESGFEGLRTRDIAARVGINIATFHYHVPTKAALVELLAQSLRDDFMAQHAGSSRDSLGPREQLRLEFEDFERVRNERPQIHLVYAELMARARRDASVAAIMQPLVDHWHGRIAEILREGVAEGCFRPDLDPPAAAAMIVGALTWQSSTGCAVESRGGAISAELMRCFGRGPQARSGDAR